MLIQIKTGAATQHEKSVLESYYSLSARLGKPIRQQRLLKNPETDM
jgi:hypothetical protein